MSENKSNSFSMKSCLIGMFAGLACGISINGGFDGLFKEQAAEIVKKHSVKVERADTSRKIDHVLKY